MLKIAYRMNTLGVSRLGFSVSRRYGCATERNRFRRRVREGMRQRHVPPAGMDMVVMPAVPALSEARASLIEQDLARFAEAASPQGRRSDS